MLRRRRALAGIVLVALMLAGLAPKLLAQDGPVSVPVRVHVISGGETLWSLADRYAEDDDPRRFVHQVQVLNGLRSAKVFPGQKLTLPPA